MASLETIRLLQFRAAYNLPVHAGIEAGIFARHGLALDIAYTPGTAFLSDALREGRCDIGHTGADDVIADIESGRGADFFIFMGLHGGLFSLVGAPDCRSIGALAGRRIGVDAKSNGFALVLERMLRVRGIAGDAYELVVLGGWERRYQALIEGKISATLLTEPFIASALGAGCNLIARDFEMIPSYQGTCGAASRWWAARYADRLTRYIRAYVEATQFCFDPAKRGVCLDLLARHNDIHERAAERTLDFLLDPHHGLYPTAALNRAGVEAVLDLRADLGYLTRPIAAVEKYIDLSFYQAAMSAGVAASS